MKEESVFGGFQPDNGAVEDGKADVPSPVPQTHESMGKMGVEEEKIKIKEGVDFVFEQNPELAQIGTKEQYSEYLDTIFPDSKIKNIVYHGSRSGTIEKFYDNHFGTYFSYSPVKGGQHGNFIYSVIINAENPLIRPDIDVKNPLVRLNIGLSAEEYAIYDKDVRDFYNPISFSPEQIRSYKYDSAIEGSTTTNERIQIKVRTPEQIHILGSKQDIGGFKNFVEGNVGFAVQEHE